MHPEPATEVVTDRYESTSSGSTGAILGRIGVSLAAIGVLELFTYILLSTSLSDASTIASTRGLNALYLVAGLFGAAAGAAISFWLFPPEPPTYLEEHDGWITVRQPRPRGDARVVRFENKGLELVDETSDWLVFRSDRGQCLRIHRHYESTAEQAADAEFNRRENGREARIEMTSEAEFLAQGKPLGFATARDTVRFGPDVKTYVLHLEEGHLVLKPSAFSSLMEAIEG